MRVSILTAIRKIMENHLENLLLVGAFLECRYERTERFVSYSLFEYSDLWARYAKVVDEQMKVELDPVMGVFTRKHSKAFLEEVENLIFTIREEHISNHPERFRSFADRVS